MRRCLHIEPLVLLPRWLAWSPDGKKIAYPDIPARRFWGNESIRLGEWENKTLTFADNSSFRPCSGPPGGDGLLVTFRQKGPDLGRIQIGFVALSDGQVRPVSHDTNTYSTLTLSADGKTLATVQQKAVSNLFVLPGAGSTSATADSPVGRRRKNRQFQLDLRRRAAHLRFRAAGANRCSTERILPCWPAILPPEFWVSLPAARSISSSPGPFTAAPIRLAFGG